MKETEFLLRRLDATGETLTNIYVSLMREEHGENLSV